MSKSQKLPGNRRAKFIFLSIYDGTVSRTNAFYYCFYEFVL